MTKPSDCPCCLREVLAGSNMFSRTSERSHSIVIEFQTLEAMQAARDAIIKASVPEVRSFAESQRKRAYDDYSDQDDPRTNPHPI